jgi:uncharacterized protein YqjF (DUF2071 family)
MHKVFLEADWRKLIMANYPVPPDVLKPYVPHRTELDFHNGVCHVSLVGFMFLNTRVKGFRIPFHSNFEEVNLRFYVRHKQGQEWKRGTVFIKEFVPRRAIAVVANTLYNEPYSTLPMKHTITQDRDRQTVEYSWKRGGWHSMKVVADNEACDTPDDSEEAFISEHYWGYNRVRNNATLEYGVEHAKWPTYNTIESSVNVEFGQAYGPRFAFLQHQAWSSIFLVEGSPVIVREGTRLP